MLHRSTPPAAPHRSRTARRALGVLGPAVLIGIVLASPAAAAGPTLATEATGAVADAGCTDQQVTVVVDLTDLGGQIEVGCADVPATGTEALVDAGFVESRDPGGFICAIDNLPDPCPTEFTGSFWSYWHGEPGGQWQVYDQGSDTAQPVAGHSEGWRYNDGSQGPGLAPAAGSQATDADADADDQAGTQDTAADQADDQAATADHGADPQTASGPSPATLAGIALVVLLALAGVLTAARRRATAARGDGPAGQD